MKINLCDLESNHWLNIKFYKEVCKFVLSPATCFDEMRNQFFIGGGGLFRISKYDMTKNTWSHLPATTRCAYNKKDTILWIDSMNLNLLFIASSGTNNMQFIDLRGNKGWKNVHCGICKPSLHNLFGVSTNIGSSSKLLIS